jgi:predicted RecA/RadA family phage recombinase
MRERGNEGKQLLTFLPSHLPTFQTFKEEHMKKLFGKFTIMGLVLIAVILVLGVLAAFAASPKDAGSAGLAAGLMGLGLFGVTGVASDTSPNLRTCKYTHTAAVVSGDIIIAGDNVLQCVDTAAINTETTYIFQGKVTWPKEGSLAINVLDQVFWSVANSNVTTTQAGNILIGICAEKALAADTTVVILLAQNAAFITSANGKTRSIVALSDANATPTATQLIDSGLFTMTPGAGRTFTVPTAALLVAAIPGCRVGSSFDFSLASLAAFAVTVTTATGITLVGSMAPNNSSATFKAVVTNATLTTEAVTIMRIS